MKFGFPETTQSFIPVKRIMRDHVVRRDGAKVAILRCTGKTCSELMKPDEKIGMILKCNKLLNSLPYNSHLQIEEMWEEFPKDEFFKPFRRSLLLNKENTHIMEMLQEQVEFFDELLDLNPVGSGNTFIIISVRKNEVFPDRLEMLKYKIPALGLFLTILERYIPRPSIEEIESKIYAELEHRVQSISSSLLEMEIVAERLKAKELYEFLFSYLCPGERRPDVHVRITGSDEVNRKVKDYLDRLSPTRIEFDKDYFKVNSEYGTTLFVQRFKEKMRHGWMAETRIRGKMNRSQHIIRLDPEFIERWLERKISIVLNEIREREERGKPTISLQPKLEDMEILLDFVSRREEGIFRASHIVTVRAGSLEELESMVREVKRKYSSVVTKVGLAKWRMEEALLTDMPLGIDALGESHITYTSALSTAFPFSSPVVMHKKGVPYGINPINSTLVVYDRFQGNAFLGVSVGDFGSGKSFTVKLTEILRFLLLNDDPEAVVFVIDPLGEFRNLCEFLNGCFIEIGREGDMINVVDREVFLKGRSDKKFETLSIIKSVLSLMLGGLKEVELAVLDKALLKMFESVEEPTLGDLRSILLRMKNREIAGKLALLLEPYVSGSLSYFNRKTSIYPDNRLVVFSLRSCDEEILPIIMHLILNYIYAKFSFTYFTKKLIIDEAYFLLDPDVVRRFKSEALLQMITRRSRHWHLALHLISHDTEDFLRSNFGRILLKKAAIKFFHHQEKISEDTIKFHDFSKGEVDFIKNCRMGKDEYCECLVEISGIGRFPMGVLACGSEKMLLTTDPKELRISNA